MRTAPGRHGALIIEPQGRPGVLVKTAHGAEAREQIEREAAAYRRLGADERLRRLAPRLLHHDPDTATLVLELVPAGGNGDPPPALIRPSVAEWLGGALADLHVATPLESSKPQPERAPWLVWLDVPPLALALRLEPSAARLSRLVQQTPALAQGLAAVRARWTLSCACHMDVRPDNVVVPGDEAKGDPCLVDWENAGAGDPAWDLGWALGSFLSLWVRSMPADPSAPVRELVARAKLPFNDTRVAAMALWQAYLERRPSPRPVTAHVTRCAAARLLGTAIEVIDAADGLTSEAALQAQLAATMMERPEAAARDLLGIR